MKQKLSPKKYAQLLIALTKNKKKGETKETIKKFALFLKKNGALALAPRIIANYEKILLEQEGKVKLEIYSAFKLSKNNREDLIGLAKKYLQKDKFEVQEKVFAGLGSGFVLSCDNKLIDFSLESILNNLEKKLKS